MKIVIEVKLRPVADGVELSYQGWKVNRAGEKTVYDEQENCRLEERLPRQWELFTEELGELGRQLRNNGGEVVSSEFESNRGVLKDASLTDDFLVNFISGIKELPNFLIEVDKERCETELECEQRVV